MPIAITRRTILRTGSAQGLALLLAACTRGGDSPTATSRPQLEPTMQATAPTTPPTRSPSRSAPPTTPTAAATRPAAATAARGTPSPARSATANIATPLNLRAREYLLPRGSVPYGVALTPDGAAWYTAQRAGELGRLDPATGAIKEIALGQGAAPRGIVVGPDGALWLVDAGLNTLVRVDAATEAIRRFSLPTGGAGANLQALAFDRSGRLWFTGEGGLYGHLDQNMGIVQTFKAPRGVGPAGITVAPDGTIYFASFDGDYVEQIVPETGLATTLRLPTATAGPRGIAADSHGRIWVAMWQAGLLAAYEPTTTRWHTWPLPGRKPQPRAVYADARDRIWLTDDSANAILRFDPPTEGFQALTLPTAAGAINQLAGRPGEIWGAESGGDRLVVLRQG
ncbi:MAG TPA: hypothetical protein VIL85_16030 [Thermomicrobiales bacterium]